MDEQKRASVLGDLAAEAGRRREKFLDEAGHTFARFVRDNQPRLKELGGLVLIDDEPDYLFVSEEGMFSSRTRYQDEDGEWVAETEEIEDPTELIEIFNPADLYAAFADAARDEAELDAEDAEEAADDERGLGAEEELAADDEAEAVGDVAEDEEPGAAPLADDWLEPLPPPADRDDAARMLYDLALTFQERSQWREAQLLEDFGVASENVATVLGDAKIAEDEDERLWFRANGSFEGEVVPEMDQAGEPVWQSLTTPDEMVQFYDPTDLFGDLAESLAEQYPHVAPELDDEPGEDDADDE